MITLKATETSLAQQLQSEKVGVTVCEVAPTDGLMVSKELRELLETQLKRRDGCQADSTSSSQSSTQG